MPDTVKKKAEEIDYLVGKRLWSRRKLLGLSQREVGDAINVTSQQIQKYEKNKDRITSGKLYILAEFLKVQIEYFFQSDNLDDKTPDDSSIKNKDGQPLNMELASLISAFNKIKDPLLRKKILNLMST